MTFKSKLDKIGISGILTKPDGNGPIPTVVFLHGCAGLDETNNRDNAWLNRLVKWGYATFQVDSFRPRDISTICNNWNLRCGMVGKRAQDAYEARSYLSTLSFVDPNRVAVMGLLVTWRNQKSYTCGGLSNLTFKRNLND